MQEKKNFSLLQTGAVVLGMLALLIWGKLSSEDFVVPPQFEVSAERFATKCRSVSSGCRVTLKDGSVVRASFSQSLVGAKIIFYPETKGEKSTDMPMGKFLREGGFFIFDSTNFYR